MHRLHNIITTALAALLICALSLAAFAHSGKTDGNGGHKNHSTGEYHYHHGYPAHDHYDMDGDGIKDCPYKFKDNTSHNSGALSNGSGATTKPTTEKSESTETESKLLNAILAFVSGTFLIEVIVCFAYRLYWKSLKKKYNGNVSYQPGLLVVIILDIMIFFTLAITSVMIEPGPGFEASMIGEIRIGDLVALFFSLIIIFYCIYGISLFLIMCFSGLAKKIIGIDKHNTYFDDMLYKHIYICSIVSFIIVFLAIALGFVPSLGF